MSDDNHEQRLNKMKYRIITEEQENLKFPKSNDEMIEEIRKIIIDEASRILGGTKNAD